MKPVYVLLSTYNGEQFLDQLLDSVLAQDYPNIHLYVRDDGSSDATLSILEQYSLHNRRLTVVAGDNIGAVRSFFQLLQSAQHDSGYFSFCDQDDVWGEDKVSRAVTALESSRSPMSALYFSRFELVDQNGDHIGLSDIPGQRTFNNAIVENVVTGATAVFGAGLRDFMLRARPEHMVWHDWWLYIVATAFGEILYDDVPTMQSRRHIANQTTMRSRTDESVRAKFDSLRRVLKRKRSVYPLEQAGWFGETYGELLSEDRQALLRWLAQLHRDRRWMDRLRFAFSRDFVINDRLDSVGLRALVLLGYRV